MKNLIFSILALVAIGFFTSGLKNSSSENECSYNKDSMNVVMRFEIKVKPEYVSFLKQSFDECRAKVLEQEPGCLDYSLFQSYNDSTLFCLTEAWATKGAHNAHMQLAHTKKHISETQGIRDPAFKSKTGYTYWVCPGANGK
jgi:quinol monooxygenase YgiN